MTAPTPEGQTFSLASDRYQVYMGNPYGSLKLVQALQNVELNSTVPNEDIYEIGNELQRGVSIQNTQYTGSVSSLLVDTDIFQHFSASYGVVDSAASGEGTSFDNATFVNMVAPTSFDGSITLTATSSSAYSIGSTTYNVGEVVDYQGIEICVISGTTLTPSDTYVITVSRDDEWKATSEFKSANVDMVIVGRDNTANDNPFKTYYAEDFIPQGMTIETSAEGSATVSFDIEGNYLSTQQGYTLRLQKYVDATDAAADTIDLNDVYAGTEDAVQLGNGDYFFKVTRIAASSTGAGSKSELVEVTSGEGAGEYSYNNSTKIMSFGDNIVAGDRIEVTFYSLTIDSSHDYDIDFSHTSPDVVTGRYIPVLYNSTQLETASSASMSVAFNRERQMRQGYTTDYFTAAKVPSVTGSIEAMDGDLSLLKLLTKGSASSSDTQMNHDEMATYTNTNNLPINIQLLDPADGTTELMSIIIDEIQVTDSGLPIAVGSDTATSFSFKSKDGELRVTRPSA